MQLKSRISRQWFTQNLKVGDSGQFSSRLRDDMLTSVPNKRMRSSVKLQVTTSNVLREAILNVCALCYMYVLMQ